MTKYDELTDLFCELNPDEKLIIVCHFVLKLPVEHIAKIEKTSQETIYRIFRRANKKLLKVQNHSEVVSALQEVIAPEN